MPPPGSRRARIATTLNAAYADGLLSEETLVHRLDLLLRGQLVDPSGLVGDLPARGRQEAAVTAVRRGLAAAASRLRPAAAMLPGRRAPTLLALDWDGGGDTLLVGRHPSCDVVLTGSAVSRRHARLRFRDGGWVLQDLDSRNGTTVNTVRVGRCRLRPGDVVDFGGARVRID
jgi:hypothetical protein